LALLTVLVAKLGCGFSVDHSTEVLTVQFGVYYKWVDIAYADISI